MTRRTQWTLFVPSPQRERLDAIRARLDPVQHRLVGAHVTLCREDEIQVLDAEVLRSRLATFGVDELRIEFGDPVRFAGHGVLLPCIAGHESFQRLRQHVLGDASARVHEAHLTLAHPRNPRADGNRDDVVAALRCAGILHFAHVSVIEQHGSDPWRTLAVHAIGGSRHESLR